MTDVVDSTKLGQALGDARTSSLWAAHDRAARDLLRRWRGREIEKTDGLVALFDSASDAASFAIDYQRALAALNPPLSARAALHVGTMTVRETDPQYLALGSKRFEVDGLAKPVVARVMGVARGGQTLLTGDARHALGDCGLQFQPLGHWRLKGIAEPIELFELAQHAGPGVPPEDDEKAYRVVRGHDTWLPAREIKHTIPAERDQFVGRVQPLCGLAAEFDRGTRLASVVGPGGAGKTRFVIHFAWRWLGSFEGGVWFCDLSQARTLEGIFFAVAQGLDVPLGQADPWSQLADVLHARGRCLLILDNFEQVAAFAEQTLGRWMSRAPGCTFLVTTRTVLGIAGETVFALEPLPPDEAIALFARRAQAAERHFKAGPEDDLTIGRLVGMLDGLPLAIEFAAARVRVMTPSTLLARMGERFKLLASSHGRDSRQATLRTTFDWSWDLLGRAERCALAQLSIFAGGFSLASAEAVLAFAADDAPAWTVDIVHSLADKSLVRQLSPGRFGLLESVREYASDHLRSDRTLDGPGSLPSTRQRHWQHFSSMDERDAVADGCAEANNLVVACRRAAEDGQVDAAIGAMLGSWAVLRLRGPLQVGVELARTVRSIGDLTAVQAAQVAWVEGSALDLLGQTEAARATFEIGARHVLPLGPSRIQARLHAAMGTSESTLGRHADASRNLLTAFELAVAIGDTSLQCVAQNGLGRLAHEKGEIASAKAFYDRSLRLAKTCGDRRMEGGILGNLGALHLAAGRFSAAALHYQSALLLSQEVGDRRWEGNTRSNLGWVSLQQCRFDDAGSEFEAALTLSREVGNARLESACYCNLGIVSEHAGDLESACANYEKSVAGMQHAGDRRSEGQFKGYLGRVYARLGRAVESQDTFRSAEALLTLVSDDLSLGLLLCQQAEAEMIFGHRSGARALCERAAKIADEIEVEPQSELAVAVREIGQRLESRKLTKEAP